MFMFVMNLTLQTNYQTSESQKPKVAGKKVSAVVLCHKFKVLNVKFK